MNILLILIVSFSWAHNEEELTVPKAAENMHEQEKIPVNFDDELLDTEEEPEFFVLLEAGCHECKHEDNYVLTAED